MGGAELGAGEVERFTRIERLEKVLTITFSGHTEM